MTRLKPIVMGQRTAALRPKGAILQPSRHVTEGHKRYRGVRVRRKRSRARQTRV